MTLYQSGRGQVLRTLSKSVGSKFSGARLLGRGTQEQHRGTGISGGSTGTAFLPVCQNGPLELARTQRLGNSSYHFSSTAGGNSPHFYGPFSAVKPTTPLVDTTSHQQYVIKDFQTYESLVYCPRHLLICFFTASCSTWGLALLPQFQKLAAEYVKNPLQSDTIPQPDVSSALNHEAAQQEHVQRVKETGSDIPHIFLTVDVDVCPRAAYHADVDDVPTIVLMKGDDAYRHKIAPLHRTDASNLLSELTALLHSFDATPRAELDALPSRSAWYDHNIRIDNLNAQRLGWATR